jgi:hypothetical protein
MPLVTDLQHVQLLNLTKASYDRLSSDGPECLVVIVLAAISLEAFTNDLQDVTNVFANDFSVTLRSALEHVEGNRGSLLLKIEIAHLVMTGRIPDPGRQPYQDIELLLKLRNLVVHARPETVSYGEPPAGTELPRIVRSFAGRGIIPLPRPGARIGWREYVLVRPVAAWAFNTVIRTVKWLTQVCPDRNLGELLDIFMRDFTELEQ